MKKSLSVLALFALAGCQEQGGPNPIDAQKFLAGLAGPKVPTVQDALLDTAHDAEKRGDYAQAGQLYQQVLAKNPDDKDSELALADCYRRLGQFDQAIPMYDKLLSQDPAMIGAKEGKGLALIAKGDFDTPAKLLDEVMHADPKRWKTLNALGILFTTRNMQSQAQQYFEEALKYSPSNPAITNNLGLSQALDRHYDESIVTLKQAATLATAGTIERKRIDLNTALVCAISGKLDEARTITANYYSGAALDNNMGLYAHLANNDQMAKGYLNMALTESKVFYERAWGNLQSIDENGAPDNNSLAPSASGSPNTGSSNTSSTDDSAANPSPNTKSSSKANADSGNNSLSDIINGSTSTHHN